MNTFDPLYNDAFSRGLITTITRQEESYLVCSVQGGKPVENPIGWQTYPFLAQFPAWRMVSVKLGDYDREEQISHGMTYMLARAETFTLTIPGSGKNTFLDIPDMDGETFQRRTQLQWQTTSFKACKRFRRAALRPCKWGHFAFLKDFKVYEDPDMDPEAIDGGAQIARYAVQKVASFKVPGTVPTDVRAQHRKELRSANRLAITVMDSERLVQDKGHAIVVDEIVVDGVKYDLRVPVGSGKSEVVYTGDDTFVSLEPVKAHTHMLLDWQSLVNQNEFWGNERLHRYMHDEMAYFIQRIHSGDLESMLNRLGVIADEEDIDEVANWTIADYVTSGGHLMWFAGAVKQAGKLHKLQLGSRHKNKRFPVPGGRFYLMPASVKYGLDAVDQRVPRGYAELDVDFATMWVNDHDFVEYVRDHTGGADHDDAYWNRPHLVPAQLANPERQRHLRFPFLPALTPGDRVTLAWRSPNAEGEWVLLKLTNTSWPMQETDWPWEEQDYTLLPTIPEKEWEPLPQGVQLPKVDHYDLNVMLQVLKLVAGNNGVLGAEVLKLMHERMHNFASTSKHKLESIIDASVKDGGDLSQVKGAINQSWLEMVARPMCYTSAERNLYAVRKALSQSTGLAIENVPEEVWRLFEEGWLQLHADHWLDLLMGSFKAHLAEFDRMLEALASLCNPPAALYEAGMPWRKIGAQMQRTYGETIAAFRQEMDAYGEVEMQDAHWAAITEAVLARAIEVGQTSGPLLGLATHAYLQTGTRTDAARDSFLWLREIGPLWLEALRCAGILSRVQLDKRHGVAVRVQVGAYRRGMAVTVNGAWFEALNATLIRNGNAPYAQMRDVPEVLRERAKAAIDAPNAMAHKEISFHMQEERVIMRMGEQKVGVVARGKQMLIPEGLTGMIAASTGSDGNLEAVVYL